MAERRDAGWSPRGRGDGGWRRHPIGSRREDAYQAALPNDPRFQSTWSQKVESFDDMGLKETLLHGIYSYGFKQPSEIQAQAIVPIGQGRSVIAQAQSGTGKTGAFAIGILNSVDTSVKATQALILAPTRELADQIFQFLVDIGEKTPNLDVGCLKGGQPVAESRRILQRDPHVMVGTPGRIMDMIQGGYLRTADIRVACLDEADHMLSQGLDQQVREIFSYLQPGVQLLLFSATIPLPVFELASQFLRDPVKILIRAENLTLEGITQYHVNVGTPAAKFDCLLDIYGRCSIQKAIIFVNRQGTVEEVQERMTREGFTVSGIHGGMTQVERDEVMRRFRRGEARVLVATDLLARGIDVQQITLVINYELPVDDPERYLHRIGRGGRHGRKGVAINICESSEMEIISRLEQFYHARIGELTQDFTEVLANANEMAGD